MKFAVSIVSPPEYVHSRAFEEVGESLHCALKALGHESELTTETCLPGRRHIVLGSNLLARFNAPLAKDAILYNLEQIQIGSPWVSDKLLELFRRYRVWDYSRRNIDQLRSLGIQGVQHVPVGYVPELTRISRREEDIDVLFIGSLNQRRVRILRALKAAGLRTHAAFGVYGAERDALIARSTIVLNIHYYPAKVFEIVRVSYLLANGCFVISETGAAAEEESPFSEGVVFAEYDGLVDRCREYLRQPQERERIRNAGFALIKQHPTTEFLREVLDGAMAQQAASYL